MVSRGRAAVMQKRRRRETGGAAVAGLCGTEDAQGDNKRGASGAAGAYVLAQLKQGEPPG